MRQLLTDLIKSLIALVAKSGVSIDGDDTGYFIVLCVSEQPVLLSVPDELNDDDFASFRRSAVLDEKTAAAGGDDHAFKKEKGHSG